MEKHFNVRRVLTNTPLARQHERRADGKATRRPKPVDWSAFDRRRFPKAALDLALESSLAQASAEYGAIQFYARLTSALTMAGLPLDFVTASASICTDEARHADYALQMARAVTGEDVPARIEREPLLTPWAEGGSLEEIDLAILHVAAISETLACALMTAGLEGVTDATSKAFLANLAADEIHHARFGWYYLSWRSPQWTRAERQRIADSMANNILMTERRYWRGRDVPASDANAARALGLLDSDTQRATVRAVMASEVVPALDSLGLGASHVWRVRARGAAGSSPEGEGAPSEP